MDKSKGLGKDELMSMVRFGAEKIFKSQDSDITDADIDAILARGEEKTNLLSDKIKNTMDQTMKNFSLADYTSGGVDESVFLHDKEEDEKKGWNFISLPQRERRRTVQDSHLAMSAAAAVSSSRDSSSAPLPAPRRPKGITMHDYQFFNAERIQQVCYCFSLCCSCGLCALLCVLFCVLLCVLCCVPCCGQCPVLCIMFCVL